MEITLLEIGAVVFIWFISLIVIGAIVNANTKIREQTLVMLLNNYRCPECGKALVDANVNRPP